MRLIDSSSTSSSTKFQFTHPVWGATDPYNNVGRTCIVSIHAPRVGCDSATKDSANPPLTFQFTHPVWGATWHIALLSVDSEVSIHAPRVGCDKLFHAQHFPEHRFQFTHPVWGATHSTHPSDTRTERFNSRTPCGVRPHLPRLCGWQDTFQFTHPVWGATAMPKGTH